MTLVTPLVNDDTFPRTLLEKFCTPPTTDAANAEPGRLGKETLLPPGIAGMPAEVAGMLVVLGKVGS